MVRYVDSFGEKSPASSSLIPVVSSHAEKNIQHFTPPRERFEGPVAARTPSSSATSTASETEAVTFKLNSQKSLIAPLPEKGKHLSNVRVSKKRYF